MFKENEMDWIEILVEQLEIAKDEIDYIKCMYPDWKKYPQYDYLAEPYQREYRRWKELGTEAFIAELRTIREKSNKEAKEKDQNMLKTVSLNSGFPEETVLKVLEAYFDWSKIHESEWW